MPTVLIVDDEQHIRLLIEQTLEELEDEGVQLLTASDGEEALEVATPVAPVATLVDPVIRQPARVAPRPNGVRMDTEHAGRARDRQRRVSRTSGVAIVWSEA